MTYWLDLFTGNTWREFQAAGATLSGFRERNWSRAANIKPGDVFLCYLVGVKRWVGLLEVTSDRFRDETPIYKEEIFPIRFRVKPILMLNPENGVPMESLRGKLSFFPTASSKWWGHVRNSPTKYKLEDGAAISAALNDANQHPVRRAVNKRQLERSANLYKTKVKIGGEEVERVVSIPSAEDEEETAEVVPAGGPTHTEIQWRLLDLGSKMGLEVWAPRRDRGKLWGDKSIAGVDRMRDRLPSQFNRDTNRTIEEHSHPFPEETCECALD